MAIDPVCGMDVNPETAFATREHAGRTFYYYSHACVEKFDAIRTDMLTRRSTSITTDPTAQCDKCACSQQLPPQPA